MELKKWEESLSAKYKVSLTEVEQKYLSVSASTNKVKECTPQEFKKVILFACVTYGISAIPSPEEERLLYTAVQSCYPHNTIEELNYALFLNATGHHWERVQCYNLLSIPFLCDCMNRYVEWSRKLNLELRKKEVVETRPSHTLESGSVDWVQWLQRDKASKHQHVATAFSRLVITKLYNLGVLNDSDFTEQDWQAFEKNAEREYKQAKRTTEKPSKKTIFMSCVYAHVLSNEQLFNKVIQRLQDEKNK